MRELALVPAVGIDNGNLDSVSRYVRDRVRDTATIGRPGGIERGVSLVGNGPRTGAIEPLPWRDR